MEPVASCGPTYFVCWKDKEKLPDSSHPIGEPLFWPLDINSQSEASFNKPPSTPSNRELLFCPFDINSLSEASFNKPPSMPSNRDQLLCLVISTAYQCLASTSKHPRHPIGSQLFYSVISTANQWLPLTNRHPCHPIRTSYCASWYFNSQSVTSFNKQASTPSSRNQLFFPVLCWQPISGFL